MAAKIAQVEITDSQYNADIVEAFYEWIGGIDNVTSASPTHFLAHNSALGIQVVVNGSGFAFAQDGTPTAGTITSILIEPEGSDRTQGTADDIVFGQFSPGISLQSAVAAVTAAQDHGDLSKLDAIFGPYTYEFSGNVSGLGFHGSDTFVVNDVITGSTTADNLSGGAGDDTISGNDGNDTLNGDAGNDTLIGGAGNDTLDGGAGTGDTADYSYLTAGSQLTITLGVNGAATTASHGGTDEDTLSNIENLTGGAENDIFTGNTGVNVLKGGAGDDTLNGNGGKDVLDGGADFGGFGDTADFTGITTGLTIALKDNDALTTVTGGGSVNGTQLIGIESLIGSDGNDRLTGNSGSNRIDGGDGDDVIVATKGTSESYDGGDGLNTLTFEAFTTGVTVDLQNGNGHADGIGSLTFGDFNIVKGGSGDDTLTASQSVATTLYGNAGNDLIISGGQADQLDGGAGTSDTVSYAVDSVGVTIDLTHQYTVNAIGAFAGAGIVQGGAGSFADGDKLAGFENVTGGSGADKITGDNNANILFGGGGDDTISGGAGNDVIEGGGQSGMQGDHLTGGGGIDTLSYAHDTTGVTVYLGEPNATTLEAGAAVTIPGISQPVSLGGGDAFLDTIIGFTNLTGGSGSDTLIGNSVANVISGGSGFDTLYGLGGNDTLSGGDDDDTLDGGTGADSLDGGAGNDTVDYSHATNGVTANLSKQYTVTNGVFGGAGVAVTGDTIAAGDKLANIENVTGGDGADVLTGSSGVNILLGRAGNDTINGNGGADFLDGGTGIDTVSYVTATAGVTVDLTVQDGDHNDGSGNADLTQTGGVPLPGTTQAGGEVLFNFENIIGSTHNDVLSGFSNTDILSVIDGGAGDDVIKVGLDSGTDLGGAGNDTISFENVGPVTVNLAGQGVANAGRTGVTGGTAGHGQIVFGDTDSSVAEIENVIGSSHDDSITGDSKDNVINGGGGNDTLDGGAGNDTVSFEGSADAVNLLGLGTYNATTKMTASSDVAVGTDTDHIANFENVTGSSLDDTLVGNNGANVLTGGDGADFLAGVEGDDRLIGGAGDDDLTGGVGKDYIDGGANFDRVNYQNEIVGVTITLGVGGGLTSFKAVGGNATGDTIINVENIFGTDGNDVLTGNELNNAFDASDGNDTLSGGAGNDDLRGSAGNDLIEGGAGNDYLDGGNGAADGIDTVSYAHSAMGVFVDLRLQDYTTLTAQAMTHDFGAGSVANGDAAGDVLEGFSNIVGSTHNDVLVGDAGDNIISGGDGDDIIAGGGGNDTLDGGKGVNTLSFESLSDDLFVILNGAQSATVESAATFGIFSNFQNVVGGSGNDQLSGDAGNNALSGGDGDDLLSGGAGNDTLTGGAGNDTYYYDGQGKDTITDFEGGAGAGDVIAIGTKFANFTDLLASTADVNGSAVITFSATASLTLTGVLKATLDADDFDFALAPLGTAGPDNLVGTVYGEKIDGLAGDDIIEGRQGGDTLIGGIGNDTLSYEHSDSYVNVELIAGKVANTGHGDALGDVATGFENIRGSAFDDSLAGDAGNNIIEGGVGADSLEGGGGTDLVSYAHSATAVYINLDVQDGTAQSFTLDTVVANGDAVGDVLQGFKGFIGSAFNDVLQGGGSFGNTAFGMDGDDDLSGGSGNFADTLNGGAGNDSLYGGLGADILNGGDGEDALTYGGSGATVGITITLDANGNGTGIGGEAQGDKFTSIEDVYGSEFADKLTGNQVANYLSGQDGNDVVSGGAGDDTLEGNDGDDRLIGGAGNDILDGGNGFDTVDYSASAAGVVVALYAQGDYLTPGDPASGRDPGNIGMSGSDGDADGDNYYSIESIIGSKFNDTLFANAAGSRLDGGAGDDELTGGAGQDTLIGGAGIDYAYYENSTGGMTIDLSRQWTVAANGTLSGGAVAHGSDADGDMLSGIENITAGSGNDVLIGDNNANSFFGGAGDNRLDGRGGNDHLEAAAGADTFVYDGQGQDVVENFAKSDGDHIEITFAPAGVSSVHDLVSHAHQVGIDTVIDFGGGKTLTLLGVNSTTLDDGDFVWNPPIKGTAGNDTINGDPLYNNIDGLAGNDIIEGFGGGDTMTGGAGIDTLSYEHSGAGVSVTLVAGQAALTSGGDADGDVATLFENIKGSSHDDTLTGDSGANVIDGGAGNDTINGGAGNDTLMGGAGNDMLIGGGGTDTADFSYLINSEFTVTLDASGNGTTSGFANDIDTLSSIVNLTGGGENDHFTGSTNANVFVGADGDDHLTSGGGKDILDGGAGSDTADFTGVTTGLTIALKDNGALTTVTGGGTSNGTQLIGIEHLVGSDGNDTLTGNSGVNSINGGAGDDTIVATAGRDIYDGDLFSGNISNNDTLTFASFKTDVSVDLTGTFNNGSTVINSVTSLYSITHFENLIGGSGNDTLIGNASDPTKILAGAGNDIVRGGSGADQLDGGAGTDTLDLSTDTSTGMFISLDRQYTVTAAGVFNTTATSMTGTGGLADGDKFANFENIIGGSGDDTLIGSTATANILEGGAGNDTLIGLGSNDTVSYAHDSAGVTIDLNHQGSGSFSGTSFSIALHPSAQTGGDAAGDMLFGFANIIGGSGDDHLTGDAGNNVINGGAGDDFLEGGKGSDTLLGGAGDDEIQLGIDHSSDASGSGGDTVDGGDGRDLVSYGVGDHSLAGVTITLGTNGTLTGFSASGGDAVGDKLTNVEDISGTWLNDKLTGNNLDNELSGGGSGDDILSGMAGDDTLLGVSGNDTLIGGVGNDILDGGADTDAVNYSASALGVTVDLSQQGTYAMNGDRNNDAVAQHGGDAEGDMLWGIENIVGSNLADTLTGDLHDNNINGGLGNDIIEGGAGNDTLTGGGGIDTLSYLHASGDVFVTLHTGAIATASGSDAQGDMATGFVNLIGGIGNDTLDGSHDIAANIIDGGGLGNDTLIGGIGDTVSFAHRSVGVTVELDGANQATVGGGASGDHISGFANIIGSSGGDQLTGDAGNNVIDGGDGTDTLTGGAGNDMLLGGGGNDVFMAGGAGGAGIDSYDGGSGDLDEVDYSGETVGFTVTLGLDGKAAKVTGGAGSNAAGDTLANIDYIVGSAGNDMIVGGNVTHNLERFDGGTGDDILKGGAGNSTLNGEAGNDKIFASTGSQENYSGGADIDTLTFETFKTGVSVTIGQSFVPGSAVGIDHLTVADDFEILIGGSGNDILAGDGTNAITINGGLGNDIIESGAGADTLMGGGGTDTLSYRHASGDVFVTLHTGAIATASGNDAQGDMATGFVNLIGGVGNDTLDGSHDTAANIIDGGGLGNDTLIGGIGDTVSFAQRQAGVFVTLNQTGEAIVGGGAAGDHITGFNSIIGSAFDDGLTGGLGNDTIFGGDGNDVLSGGLGINTVNGGDGTDVGSYQNGTFSVTVMLAAGSVVHSTARDTLQSVELVLGASNNDIYNATGFSGTSKNAGSVSVGDEDGSFNGFRGGGGDDSITGNGNTIVLYDDATAGVIVNLDTVAHSSAGGVGSDVLAQQAHGIGGDNGVGTDTFHNGIAQVEGSNFDDILIGGSANDVFYGLAGDDQIYGGAGSDTAGYNIIKSGDTALSDGDGISVNLATGDVTGLTSTATTLIGHDTLHSIESIIGSNADDTYVATAFGGSSTNAGSDGNSNQFEGMDGDDTVTGNGDTRVSYQHASAEVTVTLTHDGAGFSGNLLGSDAAKVGDDTFTGGVNAVRGSDFNDQITGNGEGDTLDGWLGNDTLTGDAGMDTFVYSIGTSGNTRGGGADVVTNFQLGIDKIDLTGVSTVHTLAQVTALMKDVGTDVVIDFHNGNTLTIDNVHKADLHTSDFVLH